MSKIIYSIYSSYWPAAHKAKENFEKLAPKYNDKNFFYNSLKLSIQGQKLYKNEHEQKTEDTESKSSSKQ